MGKMYTFFFKGKQEQRPSYEECTLKSFLPIKIFPDYFFSFMLCFASSHLFDSACSCTLWNSVSVLTCLCSFYSITSHPQNTSLWGSLTIIWGTHRAMLTQHFPVSWSELPILIVTVFSCSMMEKCDLKYECQCDKFSFRKKKQS